MCELFLLILQFNLYFSKQIHNKQKIRLISKIDLVICSFSFILVIFQLLIKNRKLFDLLEVSNAHLSHEHSYFLEGLAQLKSYYLYQNMELKRFHHRSDVLVEYDCYFSQVKDHYIFLCPLMIPDLNVLGLGDRPEVISFNKFLSFI